MSRYLYDARADTGQTGQVVLVAGTRPEVIKLAPVYVALRRRKVDAIWLTTGQHDKLLDDAFGAFKMRPDVRLVSTGKDDSLGDLHRRLSDQLKTAYDLLEPRMVVVQGDTLSAAVACQMAFLMKIPTAHVEAGLRTWNPKNPFPEEACRVWIDAVADLKFAPTQSAYLALSGEVYLTGQTGIDALGMVGAESKRGGRYGVVTMHRRENIDALKGMCEAVKQVAMHLDHVVVPVHLNPDVRKAVVGFLQGQPKIKLVEPLGYADMVDLIRNATVVLTDSGGVQEDCLGLHVPCVVMRTNTERPEGVQTGGAILAGTDRRKIADHAVRAIIDENLRAKMIGAANPYGDGRAGARIAYIIKTVLDGKKPSLKIATWRPREHLAD